MKPIELKKLRKAMEKSLDSKRYEHTLGVEYTAACLAMRYGVPVLEAQIAGLMHDCAKCLSDEKRLSICEKNKIPVSAVERKNPSLLHAKVGRFLAEEEYGIEEEGILSAIEFHTTGRPNMTLLEQIVFVADYIEPGRNKAPNLAEIREKVFVDLDAATLQILEDTLHYLDGASDDVDPMTEQTLQYYRNKIKN